MLSRSTLTILFVAVLALTGTSSAVTYHPTTANGNWVTDSGTVWAGSSFGPPDNNTKFGLIGHNLTVDSAFSTGGYAVGSGTAAGSLTMNSGAAITVLSSTTSSGPGKVDVGGTGGAGTITQNAGSLTIQDAQFDSPFRDALNVGAFGLGTYNLVGGSVTTELKDINVGWYQVGVFNQSAGTSVTIGSLLTGAAFADLVLGTVTAGGGFDGNGTYNMNGGTLSIFGTIRKGPGLADFNFNGGLITLKGNQTGFDATNVWFTPTAPGGTVYTESYNGGLDQTTLFFAPVPEPSSLVLVSMGLAALTLVRRRSR